VADVRNPLWWPVPAAVVLLAACSIGGRPTGPIPGGTLEDLEAVCGLDDVTSGIWPGWYISRVPVALCMPDSTCYLIHHPRPPISFQRVRGRPGLRSPVYRGALRGAADPGGGTLNGVGTAFVRSDEFAADRVGSCARAAFAVFLGGMCSARLSQAGLAAEYPVSPRHLAMVDVECGLLRRAADAPEDSLLLLTAEFLAVRQLRSLTAGPRCAAYERRLELRDGLPRYAGERVREAASSASWAAAGSAAAGGEGAGPAGTDDLDWYRSGRFSCTGSRVCRLLDRVDPSWKARLGENCADLVDLLRGSVPEPLPRGSDVLNRMGLDARAAQKAALADAAKTPETRLFESVAQGPGPVLCIVTRQLSSVSVSLDRENMVRVDDHREVHTRVLKAEFSGGTHVYVTGSPVAATLGGPLEYQQFELRLPPDMVATADGTRLDLTPGIHAAGRGLLVEGTGLSVEARSATVIVGANRTTIVLQQ
jgi:hypothetical protein